MFAKRRQAKARKDELARMNSEINDIRHDLNHAWQTFNSTTDPSLTEASIFEINSLRAKYDHILKGARSYFL